MKPTILFINLPYIVYEQGYRSFASLPYGLLSVASYNKDIANIYIADGNMDNSIDINLSKIKPDIIGIAMQFDNSYKYLSQVLDIIRNYDKHVLAILGGAAASFSYKEILEENPQLDAICFGEGEMPLRRLIEGYKRDGHYTFDGAWVNRSGIVPTPEYINNLDTVIDIDYSFINPSLYTLKESWSPFIHDGKKNQFFLMTSRGCPFSCTFCGSPTIHGRKMRYASVDSIISHVKRLVDEYKMDVLTIYDDQFLIDMPRTKELLRRLEPFKLRIECPIGFSVKFIDKEMAHLMKLAGMNSVSLAIENGSEYVLHKIMNKPLNLSMVKPAVDWLHEEGLFVYGFFVMGMPGETYDHRNETFKFIKDIDIDWSHLSMAMPLRGSQLYKDCVANGWIPKKEIGSPYAREYVIRIPGVDVDALNTEVHTINIWVNFEKNRRMRIGDYKTAAACFEDILKYWPGHEQAKKYLKICQERMKDEHSKTGQT